MFITACSQNLQQNKSVDNVAFSINMSSIKYDGRAAVYQLILNHDKSIIVKNADIKIYDSGKEIPVHQSLLQVPSSPSCTTETVGTQTGISCLFEAELQQSVDVDTKITYQKNEELKQQLISTSVTREDDSSILPDKCFIKGIICSDFHVRNDGTITLTISTQQEPLPNAQVRFDTTACKLEEDTKTVNIPVFVDAPNTPLILYKCSTEISQDIKKGKYALYGFVTIMSGNHQYNGYIRASKGVTITP